MSDILFLLTPLTALLFIVALFLWRYYGVSGDGVMWAWFIHAALYWIIITVTKLFFGYIGPSKIISIWASILFMQAPITIIGAILLRKIYRD